MDLRTLAYHWGAIKSNYAFDTLSSSPAEISGYWQIYKRLIEEDLTPKSKVYVGKHQEVLDDPLHPIMEIGKLLQEGFSELSEQKERFVKDGSFSAVDAVLAIAKLETVKRWTELMPEF